MRKNNKLQLSSKGKKLFKMYVMGVSIFALTIGTSMNVLAADDPMAVVNNLSNFIFEIVQAVGVIMVLFGLVQFGLALKSHDPSQRANSLLTIVGGLVIAFAKVILNSIMG